MPSENIEWAGKYWYRKITIFVRNPDHVENKTSPLRQYSKKFLYVCGRQMSFLPDKWLQRLWFLVFLVFVGFFLCWLFLFFFHVPCQCFAMYFVIWQSQTLLRCVGLIIMAVISKGSEQYRTWCSVLIITVCGSKSLLCLFFFLILCCLSSFMLDYPSWFWPIVLKNDNKIKKPLKKTNNKKQIINNVQSS